MFLLSNFVDQTSYKTNQGMYTETSKTTVWNILHISHTIINCSTLVTLSNHASHFWGPQAVRLKWSGCMFLILLLRFSLLLTVAHLSPFQTMPVIFSGPQAVRLKWSGCMFLFLLLRFSILLILPMWAILTFFKTNSLEYSALVHIIISCAHFSHIQTKSFFWDPKQSDDSGQRVCSLYFRWDSCLFSQCGRFWCKLILAEAETRMQSQHMQSNSYPLTVLARDLINLLEMDWGFRVLAGFDIELDSQALAGYYIESACCSATGLPRRSKSRAPSLSTILII